MNEAEILEIARESLIVAMKVGAPVMIVALIVGLAISLLQALTQMQEQTLSFVPKIIMIVVSLMLFMPFMLATLSDFTQRLMERIATAS